MSARKAWKMLAIAASIAFSTNQGLAQKYDVGASDGEIRIGNLAPYSGPASAYSVHGRLATAFFDMINQTGGINGRKIKFITYDDAYSPPKAVEQARKLVEGDEVLFLFSPLGTPSNSAIMKYMNAKKVPQLFVASGGSKFQNPKDSPWTMGFQPSYQTEGLVYAAFLRNNHPDAKIAVLYQNDDFGKDVLKGFKEGLGASVSHIVGEEAYEVSEPTLDSRIVKLKASQADVFVNITSAKFTAQALKKAAELNWKPLQIVTTAGASVGAVLRPVGLDNVQGLISAAYLKDSSDAHWAGDEGMKRFFDFLTKYAPSVNKDDSIIGFTFAAAEAIVQVLRQCGDDLTRENVMRQAANLKNFTADTTLPGITINTSPSDYSPIEQLQIMRFSGEHWGQVGPLLSPSPPQ
jgi:branched-chain amino acid transport system substrate-binding protein